MNTETEELLRDLKREVVETRGLVIKTNHLATGLSGDIRLLGRRVEDHEHNVFDVNMRDHNGYNAVHHAAARGDNDLIKYLASKGGDIMAISRRGQTTVDMANGPVQRIPPFLETVDLLVKMGAKNSNKCKSC